MVGIVPEKIAAFGSSYRRSAYNCRSCRRLRSFLSAHPMKQVHRVKNMRQRFIVADLRFIK
ncbi:hypothetical protein DBR18_00400 [Pseudomonas sp. HMWF021]|nr:hypothetical protein DBR18_00400 [Pseudomonas sp. HMWF021]